MKNCPDRFEFIDHTGDIGISVWSPTLTGIFATAAKGMFSTITDFDTIEKKVVYPISLMANENSELLVRWLNHLNFLFSTEGILFCDFSSLFIKKGKLNATVWGESYNSDKHEIFHEIKAVTYHQLILEQQKMHWFAQVIFDI